MGMIKVEFFSVATSARVCGVRSCNAPGAVARRRVALSGSLSPRASGWLTPVGRGHYGAPDPARPGREERCPRTGRSAEPRTNRRARNCKLIGGARFREKTDDDRVDGHRDDRLGRLLPGGGDRRLGRRGRVQPDDAGLEVAPSRARRVAAVPQRGLDRLRGDHVVGRGRSRPQGGGSGVRSRCRRLAQPSQRHHSTGARGPAPCGRAAASLAGEGRRTAPGRQATSSEPMATVPPTTPRQLRGPSSHRRRCPPVAARAVSGRARNWSSGVGLRDATAPGPAAARPRRLLSPVELRLRRGRRQPLRHRRAVREVASIGGSPGASPLRPRLRLLRLR